ncbi:homocitrate synthase/isopropylmalate synthase family protein [Desulfurobacterium sp.]
MIILADTTLRDGLQAPGIKLSFEERFKVASILKSIGIREIEAGIPIVSDEERSYLKRLVWFLEDDSFRVLMWCRGLVGDIEAALSCHATSVNVSFPVSEQMIKYKICRDKSYLYDQMKECIRFAKDRGLFVSLGCEDATRADFEFLVDFVKKALDCGVDRVRIADTVGISDPFSFYELISKLKKRTGAAIEVHTHNDFGLACANALAGVKAGAEAVSVTVNGIGERAGNAPLEQVAISLEFLLNLKTGLLFPRLKSAVYEILSLMERIPEDKAPVVGKNVFTHKSGIHIDGVLKHPSNYMPLSPELFGEEVKFYLGYYSGKKTLSKLLKTVGVSPDERLFNSLYRFLFDTGISFSLSDLKSFIINERRGDEEGKDKHNSESHLSCSQNG